MISEDSKVEDTDETVEETTVGVGWETQSKTLGRCVVCTSEIITTVTLVKGSVEGKHPRQKKINMGKNCRVKF